MTKAQMKVLLEYVKTEAENSLSSFDPTTADELCFWSELTRFCSHEVASLAFDQVYNETEGK